MNTLLRTTSTLILILTLASSCSSGRKQQTTAQSNGVGYGTQLAKQDNYMDEAIEDGTIDTWVSSPMYLTDKTPVFSIHRGPKPAHAMIKHSLPSQLNTRGSSKISWSRNYQYQDALLNMMLIHESSEELIFPDTPHAFEEFLFLTNTPPPTTTTQAAPPQHITLAPEGDDTNTQTVNVVLHQPNPQQHPTQPKLTGPQLIQGPVTASHVANFFDTWSIAPLKNSLAIGCAVLREETTIEDDKKAWRYHGEIWIRDLNSDRVFKHGSKDLEPTSWQLYPGEDRAQLEVVMSDAEGWPTRIDFIDLNTFEVRSMPTRGALKEMGLK